MVTITVIPEEGQAFSFEVDSYNMDAEHGIAKMPGEGGYMRVCPNGQFRILLKGWRGCADYDHFTTEAERHMPDPGCGGKHPVGTLCPFCNPNKSEEPV